MCCSTPCVPRMGRSLTKVVLKGNLKIPLKALRDNSVAPLKFMWLFKVFRGWESNTHSLLRTHAFGRGNCPSHHNYLKAVETTHTHRQNTHILTEDAAEKLLRWDQHHRNSGSKDWSIELEIPGNNTHSRSPNYRKTYNEFSFSDDLFSAGSILNRQWTSGTRVL